LDLSFTETIAAVLGANLITVAFVFAIAYAQKHPGFSQPWLVWAGVMMPLVFVILGMVATGDLPHRSGG
jgi:uncharacterized membrane protein